MLVLDCQAYCSNLSVQIGLGLTEERAGLRLRLPLVGMY